ncbi:leucine-tRNA ligase precursor, mitochondrial [Polychytrium aggregatum]|uniref:leucine-tRNA ligase precursor, mitochondrial n=1 Tax=Polychytrium aggregatum TaxID=110093 RepID=UPI0022FE81A0|nr:leucine-tRNA ligase precursor, mitochondrial [Polychytrium aggregatum]KAI9207671.1 leucine-tRNA ligase precursor, mitochondrial [Polychytrium aggregatum]
MLPASGRCPRFTSQRLSVLSAPWSRHWSLYCLPLRRQLRSAAHSGAQGSQQQHASFYVLPMFPYPSGNLHLGHTRVYTISDVISRFRKAQGFEVIHPIGWDAFGLPAENAAIDHGIPPHEWTADNIDKMKAQMHLMGVDFDWTREIRTCDPAYYRWTQKLFLDLFQSGLAYQREALVNWDPVDRTVLANEQVDECGRAERSGALVEKRHLKQWFFKITEFCEELHRGLAKVDWPANVINNQYRWIGRRMGIETPVDILTRDGTSTGFTARVFAEDVQQLQAVSEIWISAEHSILESSWISPELSAQIKERIQHPAGRDPREPGLREALELPLLARPRGAGGCVPVKLAPPTLSGNLSDDEGLPHASGSGTASWTGLPVKPSVKYRLRDWLVSRQRYWGTPIPIIHCTHCGPVPVPDDQLPVILPTDHALDREGGSPLARHEDWKSCRCPKCNREATRETDTMDTFVDSSWYWLRFCDPNNHHEMSARHKSASLPVNLYVGGVEHSIMHLLYARFVGKFLHRQGVWAGSSTDGEPFQKLLAQGMVQGRTWKCSQSGRYLRPDDVVIDGSEMRTRDGHRAVESWEKMSKSKSNGVDPAEIIKRHGADALRLYILFKAPPQDDLRWDERAIVGMERWMVKMKQLCDAAAALKLQGQQHTRQIRDTTVTESESEPTLVDATIRSVTTQLQDTYHLNVAISDLMKLTNWLTDQQAQLQAADSPSVQAEVFVSGVEDLIRMITVFAPTLGSECRRQLDIDATWPRCTSTQAAKVRVSVNLLGKPLGAITLPHDEAENTDLVIQRAIDEAKGRIHGFDPDAYRVVLGKDGRVVSFAKRKQ